MPETRPLFSFPDYNLSKCQGILTKLGTCIDIKEIWFWIANGQILSTFDRVICPRHDNGRVLGLLFYVFILFYLFIYNERRMKIGATSASKIHLNSWYLF